MGKVNILSQLNVEVPGNLLEYSKLKSKYEKIAHEVKTVFEKEYDSLETIDSVIEHGFSKGTKLITAVAEMAVAELISKGLYDINNNYFIDNYVINYFEFGKVFFDITDKWAEIYFNEAEQKQYRENRKDSRGKWGVIASTNSYSDALLAKMKVGVWNLTEGAGHSIFNAIGNYSSAAEANKKKRELYDYVKPFLVESIFQTCFYIHFALIDVLEQNHDSSTITKKELINKEAFVERLLENLKKKLIPENDIYNVIKSIIVNYPLNTDFYEYLIVFNRFKLNEVIELANYFSVDLRSLLLGDSFLVIKENIKNYDFVKRAQLLEKIEKIGVTGTEYDLEIKEIKHLCLTYNDTVFDDTDELQKEFKSNDLTNEKFMEIFKDYKLDKGVYMDEIHELTLDKVRECFNISSTENIFAMIGIGYLIEKESVIIFGEKGIYTKKGDVSNKLLYKDLNKIEKMDTNGFGVNITYSGGKLIVFDTTDSGFNSLFLLKIFNRIIDHITGKSFIQKQRDDNWVKNQLKNVKEIENLIGNSLEEFKLKINDYDYAQRFKLLAKIEKYYITDTELAQKVKMIKSLCLTYHGKLYNNIDDLGKKIDKYGQRNVSTEGELNYDKLLEILKDYNHHSGIYIDNIPQKKLQNAREYFLIPSSEDKIVLIDTTLFGSAKDGVALGKEGIYSKYGSKITKLLYKDINYISKLKNNEFTVFLTLINNEKISYHLAGSGFKAKHLLEIIDKINVNFTGKSLMEGKNEKEEESIKLMYDLEITALFKSSLKMLKSTKMYDPEQISEVLSKIDKIAIMDIEIAKEFQDIKNSYNSKNLEYLERKAQRDKHNEKMRICQLKNQTITSELQLDKLLEIMDWYKRNDDVYIGDIPSKKLNNAITSYNIPSSEKIHVLINFTVFGSAKDGIAFGKKGIYANSGTVKVTILYKDICNITKVQSTKYDLVFTLTDGKPLELGLAGSSLKPRHLKKIINDIIEHCTGKPLKD